MGGFMKFLAPFALFLSAFVLTTPATAQNVSATNPHSVVRALENAGYSAELDLETIGDPMIISSSNDVRFVIFFFGCTDGRNCSSLQFYSGFGEPRNGSLKAMNEWNADNRYGRAYITDSGAARVEMDLNLDDEAISQELFTDKLNLWVAVMNRFFKFVYQ